jgi:hypothetical protein
VNIFQTFSEINIRRMFVKKFVNLLNLISAQSVPKDTFIADDEHVPDRNDRGGYEITKAVRNRRLA